MKSVSPGTVNTPAIWLQIILLIDSCTLRFKILLMYLVCFESWRQKTGQPGQVTVTGSANLAPRRQEC